VHLARQLRCVLVLVTIGLGGFACHQGDKPSAPTTSAPAAAVGPEHRFTIDVGGQPVRMRLAVLEPERNRGLMHVPSMPENEGMLFVFPRPQRMSFYMRSTPIPLDIGYFSRDGALQEVYPMHPFVEDPVLSASTAIQFALEMNQGWYVRHGVRPGAKIDLAAVRAALQERGLKPDDYLAPQ